MKRFNGRFAIMAFGLSLGLLARVVVDTVNEFLPRDEATKAKATVVSDHSPGTTQSQRPVPSRPNP